MLSPRCTPRPCLLMRRVRTGREFRSEAAAAQLPRSRLNRPPRASRRGESPLHEQWIDLGHTNTVHVVAHVGEVTFTQSRRENPQDGRGARSKRRREEQRDPHGISAKGLTVAQHSHLYARHPTPNHRNSHHRDLLLHVLYSRYRS